MFDTWNICNSIATKVLTTECIGDQIYIAFDKRKLGFLFGRYDEDIILAANQVLEEHKGESDE